VPHAAGKERRGGLSGVTFSYFTFKETAVRSSLVILISLHVPSLAALWKLFAGCPYLVTHSFQHPRMPSVEACPYAGPLSAGTNYR